jgi:hypothetical protein
VFDDDRFPTSRCSTPACGPATQARRPGLFLDHHYGHTRVGFDQSASPLVLPRAIYMITGTQAIGRRANR